MPPGRRRVDGETVLPFVAAREPPATPQPPPEVEGELHAAGVVRFGIVATQLLGSDRVTQQRRFWLIAGIPERPEDAKLQATLVRPLPAEQELALGLVVREPKAAGES